MAAYVGNGDGIIVWYVVLRSVHAHAPSRKTTASGHDGHRVREQRREDHEADQLQVRPYVHRVVVEAEDALHRRTPDPSAAAQQDGRPQTMNRYPVKTCV